MKTLRIILLITIVSFPSLSIGQETLRTFSDILQTYYLNKDKDLVERTIEFLNNPDSDYENLESLFIGFYGALFSTDSVVKNNFNHNIDRIENSEFKRLFRYLNNLNIDSILSNTPVSPEYNDMSWASFFATGDTKYVDKIILNISYASERIDRNLFLTGASAKWSLCSNARQDERVKKYLTVQKKNKEVKDILKKNPQEFWQEMIDIIEAQRSKGLWN